MTPDEWRAWERLNGSRNTEGEWLTCPAADALLGRAIELGASERKLRLFGCACSRLVFPRHHDQSHVHTAERLAVAEAMHETAAPALALLRQDDAPASMDRGRQEGSLDYIVVFSAAMELLRYGKLGQDQVAMEIALCDRLRDIIGNPYRAVRIADEWRTATVLTLAQQILSEQAFADLPILADALEDAGCTEVELLTHCRDQRLHVLGCWVVDLLLGCGWKSGPSAHGAQAGLRADVRCLREWAGGPPTTVVLAAARRLLDFLDCILQFDSPLDLPRGYSVDIMGSGAIGLCAPLACPAEDEDGQGAFFAADVASGWLDELCAALDRARRAVIRSTCGPS
jgi:hypothetical protein